MVALKLWNIIGEIFETIIRVYGFEDTPFVFPKIVPDRFAYFEIVRELYFSNVMVSLFRCHHNQILWV